MGRRRRLPVLGAWVCLGELPPGTPSGRLPGSCLGDACLHHFCSGLVGCRGVAPGVGCVVLRSWGGCRRRRRDDRSGPCAAPVRFARPNYLKLHPVHCDGWQLVLESQLWTPDGACKGHGHCPRLARSRRRSCLGSDDVPVGVHQSGRRRNPIPHSGRPQAHGREPAHHRNRPSGGLAQSKHPATARSRKQRKRWCWRAGTVRTGGSDRGASPEKRECPRKGGRSLRRKRRNRGRAQV